jgi:uncharacterized membrane protein (UPF0182 family)
LKYKHLHYPFPVTCLNLVFLCVLPFTQDFFIIIFVICSTSRISFRFLSSISNSKCIVSGSEEEGFCAAIQMDIDQVSNWVIIIIYHWYVFISQVSWACMKLFIGSEKYALHDTRITGLDINWNYYTCPRLIFWFVKCIPVSNMVPFHKYLFIIWLGCSERIIV